MPAIPGEKTWHVAKPRPCSIQWLVVQTPAGNPYAFLRSQYVQQNVLEDNLLVEDQPFDALEGPKYVHYYPLPGQIRGWPYELIQLYIGERSNTRVRYVPWGCGCGGLQGDESDQLTPVERHMAMAYEFGLVSAFVSP